MLPQRRWVRWDFAEELSWCKSKFHFSDILHKIGLCSIQNFAEITTPSWSQWQLKKVIRNAVTAVRSSGSKRYRGNSRFGGIIWTNYWRIETRQRHSARPPFIDSKPSQRTWNLKLETWNFHKDPPNELETSNMKRETFPKTVQTNLKLETWNVKLSPWPFQHLIK